MGVHYGLHTFFQAGIYDERLGQYAEAYATLRGSAVGTGRAQEFWRDNDLRFLASKLKVRVFSSSAMVSCHR